MCIEQLHYGDILNSAQSDVSSVAMPQSIRSDPKLFKDDVDIKFSHTLNSCKVPQIRYATVSRLLDRLTDARFLSIDFLNTFLLTYRVFTTGLSVIWSLNQVLANPDVENSTGSNNSSMGQNQNQSFTYSHFDNPEPRDPLSMQRPSEISLTTTTTTTTNRLPVLEEAVNSRLDDASPSPNSNSQTDDNRCELHHSNNTVDGNPVELTTTQQPSSRLEHTTTTTNTEVSNASVTTVKSQKKLLPSPISTSDMNHSTTVSGQEYNPGCMSRSEIGDSRSFFSEKQFCKSFMNRSFHSSSSASSTSSTTTTSAPASMAVKSPIINTTQSTTVLIPRSPVYSTLVDLRDDPPLELPILPNPKTSEKKQQPRESKDTGKETSSSTPISSHDDIDEGTGTVKGHARLAPLASCEVIPDETDTTSISKQESVKDFKTSLSSKENIASHEDSCQQEARENSITTTTTTTHVDRENSTTVHNTTTSHLDSQLDKTDGIVSQREIQPNVEHGKEKLSGVRREKSEDETHSSKQSESTNTSKSDIEISVSYENQPKEYLNYAPMNKINTQNIESRHFKQTTDQLSILNSQQFSHSWTTINRIACKHDTDDYNDCDDDVGDDDDGVTEDDVAVYNHHENDTPRQDNTDSRIKHAEDCQKLKKSPLSVTNLKDNDRLLESYLNQTIGSSLLATENNYDRQPQQQQQQQQQQSSGNCEKAASDDNTPQDKDRTESINCTNPVKPANSTKQQSTVNFKPHPPSHPSQKYFPVAESLDLATRLTAITKSPKSFSACQSLAKHTMIAALNCSRAFTGLQKTTANENRSSDGGVNSSIQSKYLEDNYPEFKEIIRSSPSSPKKYSEGSVMKNKNTKPNVNIHDTSQTHENENIKISPKFSTDSRTTPEIISTRESQTEARRSVPSFKSSRPISSVEVIRQKKTDTVVNEQRKLVRKVNKGQDSNTSEEGRHHQETLQPSSSSANNNSQTVPSDIMIRYATVSRLLDRLTDARFLSIDFLNTFLLTYRVFTTGLSVIWSLNQVLANPDVENSTGSNNSSLGQNQNQSFTYSHFDNPEPRDPLSMPRPSEISLTTTTTTTTNRLPVLEEAVNSRLDDTSPSPNSNSQTDDNRCELHHSNNTVDGNPVELTTTQQSSSRLEHTTTTTTNTEVSNASAVSTIKSQKKLLPSPISTSDMNHSPNVSSGQEYNPGCMSRSEIGDSRSFFSEKQSCKSFMNRSFHSSSSSTSSTTTATSAPASMAVKSPIINTTQSTTVLIPRSPVYSTLVDLRDDPPLELPILPNPKTSEKKQQPRESKDTVKETSSSTPISSHDDIDEGTGTVKGHARLAPLASCEVIPDETDPTSLSKQESVKNFKTALSPKENIASHEDSCQREPRKESITATTTTRENSTTIHNTTTSHLDSQLDKTDGLVSQCEIQPNVEHGKEQLSGVRREKSEDETHSSKQSDSTNTSKSDIEISVSYENQPKEYLNYAPMSKINTQNIESRHFKQTTDQLSILNSQQFSHSWTTINRIACKNDTDDYNDCDDDVGDDDDGVAEDDAAVYNHNENDTPREHNTDSRIKHAEDCQKLKKSPLSVTNLKDNDRLLENYLNQTIGSSLLATENNYDRQPQQQQQQQQSSGNCEKAVSDDNTSQDKDRSESINCSHPVKPASATKQQSTVNFKPHPPSHSSQKYFPVAESLDLATRLTAITKSPKSFSACQSLAKHTMIAALNCSRAFTGLQKTTANENRSSDAGVNSSIQSKYLEDNYPEFKEIIRSSPSSPKKYSEGSVMKNKNTKPNVNIHDASQTHENENIKISPKFSTDSRTTPEIISTRESQTEARRSVPSFKSTRPISSVEVIRQKKTDTTVNEQRKLLRKANKGQDSNNSEEGRHHQETLQASSSSTNNNNQTVPSDIMVKERQDSLIPHQLGIGDCARGSVVSWSGVSHISKPKRPSVFSCPEAEFESPRSSVIHPSLSELASNKRTRPGAVVTSSRRSKRRSSNTAAAQAFAVATAGSANPLAAVGIMGLGPNLFRPGGYRFSAGTATAAAAQVGLRSGSSSLSGSSTSIAVSSAVTSRSSAQSTSTTSMYPSISTGANNPVSQSAMGTMTTTTPPPPPGGPTLTSTVNSSSLVQTTPPTVNTALRYNIGRNGLNTTTSNPSVSANNTFSFHSYNLTSPTLIQHSSGGVGVPAGTTSHHCTNQAKRNTMLATASCLRVLNVVRHWITKFPDDFQSDSVLKREMQTLLDALVTCPHLMPNDQKVAGQLLLQMISDQLVHDRIDLDSILTPTQIPSEKNFDQLSALDISEQLTFLDFQIFRSIRSEELLNQSWMKLDKEEKAKHVLLVCKRFNEVSRLVVSEIISRTDLNDRVMCIDKWVAIADICRCMQNYNGVLQICAALVNSSVYRLKRTWERVSKQTKQSIDRLQMLVASDGRFKSMREALHRCDPPCIPYLGMYLTDLSFIEEGALNITENNLVNFCKMRMIAHVIREVQQYHQTPYLITHRREVTDYLLDPTRLLDEEQTYQASLIIEPRQSINRQPPTSLS
ncbi:unnamed protein product [Trichobilharzia szidati]|nr:unnamed protein product [Trichobilharzia szidati]